MFLFSDSESDQVVMSQKYFAKVPARSVIVLVSQNFGRVDLVYSLDF